MTQHLGYCLLGIAIVIASAFVHPNRAVCPPRFWVNGIRIDGSFACLRALDVEGDGPPDAELAGALYCTGGQLPIVVDERTVGCQLGGWRQ
jgi:hypothetical protein